jgi:hypothetical protein
MDAGTKDIYVYALDRNWQKPLKIEPVRKLDHNRDWAETEWGGVDLGDSRLTKRLIEFGRSRFNRPTANIPQSCGSRAATKAAYRLDFLESAHKGGGRWSFGDTYAERMSDAWATLAFTKAYASHRVSKRRKIVESAVAGLSIATRSQSREDVTVMAWNLFAAAEANDLGIPGAAGLVARFSRILDDDVLKRESAWRKIDAGTPISGRALSTFARAKAAWTIGQVALGVNRSERALSPQWAADLRRRLPTTLTWDEDGLSLQADDLTLATTALFRCEGDIMDEWQAKILQPLVAHQFKIGCARGRWDMNNGSDVAIGGVGVQACLTLALIHAYNARSRHWVFH